MTSCIVPLAGPDFFNANYGVKPFVAVGDSTLIEYTLKSRAWFRDGELTSGDVIFVLRAGKHTAAAVDRLRAMFPGCRTVVLSDGTGGAMLSAIAGVPLADLAAPLIIDLADLSYEAPDGILLRFAGAEAPQGFIPWFHSQDPGYSYLALDGDRVMETAEKRVISRHASAGTYFFKSAAVFLKAAAGVLASPERYLVRDSLFVCPAFNALIRDGDLISGVPVKHVRSFSAEFHKQAKQVSEPTPHIESPDAFD